MSDKLKDKNLIINKKKMDSDAVIDHLKRTNSDWKNAHPPVDVDEWFFDPIYIATKSREPGLFQIIAFIFLIFLLIAYLLIVFYYIFISNENMSILEIFEKSFYLILNFFKDILDKMC